MAHIHLVPGQHDLAVSAFIVRDGCLLLHRHKTMRVLMQPGGHVELGENPWQALAHEVTEETGYEFAQLWVLQPAVRLTQLDGVKVHPQPVCVSTHEVSNVPNHFHVDLSYAFVTGEDPCGKPQVGESQELVWVSRDSLASLPASEIFANVRQIGLHVLNQVLTTWDAVPVSNQLSD